MATSRLISRGEAVRRWLLAMFALVAFAGLSTVAPAQDFDNEPLDEPISAEQQFSDDIARWGRVLNRVGDQLADNDLNAAILDKLRATVADIGDQLEDARAPVLADVDRSRNLVEALGPAPKDGEPPESGEIISQREALNERLAEDQGRLQRIELLIQRSREYLSQISRAEAVALGQRLFAKTPSILSWETWRDAVTDFGALRERARRSFDRWRNLETVKEASESTHIIGALVVVLGTALLAFLLRRWLVSSFGRTSEIEQPNYRRRVLATLSETAARTAIPILVASAIYLALYTSGVLVDIMEHVALGFLAAVVAPSIIYGLPRAMLSPSQPQWRLAAVGDGAAKLWYRYASTLAVMVGLDLLVSIPVLELRPSEALTSAYGFFVNGAYALIFFAMATDKRLWLTPEEEARAIDTAVEPPIGPVIEPESRSRWWLVGRVILAGVALSIPLTLLAGYSVLSDFIALRLLATAE
ncbi:MAG: hypothetical protein AAGF14_08200 [Pseudomonadota bacterium]